MAGEAAAAMAAAIDADGGAGLPDGGAGAAPGADGGSQAAPPAPPAGESNADIAGRGGAPDTIPYARFKEVNDSLTSLKGFEPLIEFGYDPDSLGRLAAFEQQYIADPVGTWASMTDNIDLPQELKDAVAQHLESVRGNGASGAGRADGEPSGDAKPTLELPDDVKQKLEYVDRLAAKEAEAERNAQLDRVVSHWDELDKQDGLETPKDLQFRMIAAMAGSGQQFNTIEDLAAAAREPIIGYRSSVLGGAVRTGRTGAPLAVPGGASAPAGPVQFKNIRDATKAAEEAMKRGELPGIQD
jgi:hypothetical protein